MAEIRVKAQLWDRVQFLMRHYWDGMMRCIISYDGELDEDVAWKAAGYVFDSVPVLRSSYINHPIRPYWRLHRSCIGEGFKVIYSEKPEDKARHIATEAFGADCRVQCRIRLIKGDGKSLLVFVCNHMCCDGNDILYVIAKFCEAYTNLMKGSKTSPIRTGSRSHLEMYSGFNEEAAAKAKRLYKNVSLSREHYRLSFTRRRKSDKPMLIHMTLGPDAFKALKARSRREDVTVNDVLQAAFARAVYKHAGIPEEECLHISCMKNLRPSMADKGKHTGITNQIGFIPCHIEREPGNMEEAVRVIHDIMEEQKKDPFAGMYGIPLLNAVLTFLPERIAQLLILIGYKSPRYAVSNLGMINIEDYCIDGKKPYDFFFTGTVKNKPAIQLSTFTADETMHMTLAVKGSRHDEKVLTECLTTVVEELRAYARDTKENNFTVSKEVRIEEEEKA